MTLSFKYKLYFKRNIFITVIVSITLIRAGILGLILRLG
jgi:hypothetical protein